MIDKNVGRTAPATPGRLAKQNEDGWMDLYWKALCRPAPFGSGKKF